MENTSGSKTLERGLDLIDLVAKGHERLDDIARESGLSRSSAHRMLTSLVTKKFLNLTSDHRYRLGLKLMELGSRAENSLNLPAEIQTILNEISEITKDTTHLGVLEDKEVLYLAKSRGFRGVEMASRPGSRFQTQTTAMGKMLLAFAPRKDAMTHFDPARTVTEYSLATAEAFDNELTLVHQRGYSLDNQENELGIICVAIAIRDAFGSPIAAISISAPSVYMTEQRITELIELMNSYEPDLSRCLPPNFRDHWM